MSTRAMIAVAAVIGVCAHVTCAFCPAPVVLRHGTARHGTAGKITVFMQQAEDSWNFGRFAKTFGFFNGNPLLKLIPFVSAGAPSVPQPAPVAVSSNELVLWSFDGMDQVAPHSAARHVNRS